MGHSSLKIFLFPKLFEDLVSTEPVSLWGREGGQKAPAYAEAAVRQLPFSLGRGAEQTPPPPPKVVTCFLPLPAP